ncbi:hypothetical protein PISMIDRAFT_677570 [Pisolithus microcarpus 441]|uniref:Unplaced genomic scaffold scaffold_27, whole genome shotgun sequence n=1 Tax=Pisolithus microcarpus 441 TaxID=765257 RepID=A0A0C9ZS37_9AGAM|nr:hypothetical protein PISMIDRAFT_677570 [Pisolithus microcarpus 441]
MLQRRIYHGPNTRHGYHGMYTHTIRVWDAETGSQSNIPIHRDHQPHEPDSASSDPNTSLHGIDYMG